MKQFEGKIALVTGANRGMGRAYVEALLVAGAAKVYAAARDIGTVRDLATQDARVVPVALDVTKPETVAGAVSAAGDVTVLINNAGVAAFERLVGAESIDPARLEMDVNYFGALNMIRAFAPVLDANGGGVIVNMASIVSFVNFPMIGSYSASKAAVHSLTQGSRAEFADRNISVVGVYPGPVDTDMSENLEMDKASPADVAQTVLESIEAGEEDIFPDPMSTELHQGLLADPKGVERHAATML